MSNQLPSPPHSLARRNWKRWFWGISAALTVLCLLTVGFPVAHDYRRHQRLIERNDPNGEICNLGVEPGGRWPNWLRSWVGVDRLRPFEPIFSCNLHDIARESDLSLIAGELRLEHLSVSTDSSYELNDEALKHFQSFPNLNHLVLFSVRLQRDGLKHLRNSTHLETLYLCLSPATTSLQGLAEIKGLKFLILNVAVLKSESETKGRDLPDGLLLQLRNCPIQRLRLCSLPHDPGELQSLSALSNLRELELYNCTVTQADLIEIAKITQLKCLDLSNRCSIEKAALDALAEAKNLSCVNLNMGSSDQSEH